MVGSIKQRDAHAGRYPRSFAHREHVRVFTIGDAVKGHANALADGGTALLQVDIEGDGVGVFSDRMKPIAADLPMLTVICRSPASTRQDSAIMIP